MQSNKSFTCQLIENNKRQTGLTRHGEQRLDWAKSKTLLDSLPNWPHLHFPFLRVWSELRFNLYHVGILDFVVIVEIEVNNGTVVAVQWIRLLYPWLVLTNILPNIIVLLLLLLLPLVFLLLFNFTQTKNGGDGHLIRGKRGLSGCDVWLCCCVVVNVAQLSYQLFYRV